MYKFLKENYMKLKWINLRTLIASVIIGTMTLFVGCASNDETVPAVVNEDEANLQSLEDDFKGFQVKQIWYNLPSPIETAMIIRKAGVQYNDELLNPVSNVSKYTTNVSKAINMGIYSTNLSFASLFDQNQTSIKYMGVSKKLAEQLGILNAVPASIVSRLEANVNRRDSIMHIISESFLNTNEFLKSNNRSQIAALILAGGWIEGLYLSTQLIKTTDNNKDLIDRVLDQKISLHTLINLLGHELENKPDEGISNLLVSLEEIKVVYEEVKTKDVDNSVEVKGNTTFIASDRTVVASPETIEKLVVKVAEIRNNIVN